MLVAWAVLSASALFSGCTPPLPPADFTPPPWPQWVLRHWVWENEGTQQSALEFVDGFLERNIPTGAVIIDRPWEVEPTAFEPDPQRYPDLGGLVEEFHARGVRVLLWAVSMINENASTFEYAKSRGYLLSGGKTVEWWAGRGALLDYTNPEAVSWWHGLMDSILALGIDGWKCDGTDPYVLLLGGAYGLGGPITWAMYRDAYYRDFFEYTRQRLGPDRVITARPSDSYIGLPLPIPFAPRDVNFCGWVGDQDGTFRGIKAALANMAASAMLGYVNFGSDIGGFRGPEGRELFARWAQLGALSPIMENGGDGEHRPWMYEPDLTPLYRTYAVLHHELIPYLYSQGARSWERGVSLMRFQHGPYEYLLGEGILVAPFVQPGTRREVLFPKGRWIDWLDERTVYQGGTRQVLEFPLERYPVFVKEGSIVPLSVSDSTTGHGGQFSAGHLTVAVYPPPRGTSSFDFYEEGGKGIRFAQYASASSLVLEASPTATPLLWRIRGRPVPACIREDFGPDPSRVPSTADLATAPRTWTEGGDGILWVRVADPHGGVRLRLESVCRSP
jgi:alpha-glucosidase (family GH31 glycosyl hydrolase)